MSVVGDRRVHRALAQRYCLMATATAVAREKRLTGKRETVRGIAVAGITKERLWVPRCQSFSKARTDASGNVPRRGFKQQRIKHV